MDDNSGEGLNNNSKSSEKKYYGKEEPKYYGKSDDRTENVQNYRQNPSYFKKKRRPRWKKGIVILIVAAMMIAVFFSPIFNNLSDVWGGPVYPEKAEFHIARTISLSSSSEIDYSIDLPVPIDISSNNIQSIRTIEWGNQDELTTYSKYDQTWKKWDGSVIGDKEFNVDYKVTTKTIDWGYSSEESGSVDDISDTTKEIFNRNQWQLDEDRDNDGQNDWMIQPDHPQIKNKAKQIVADEDNIYEKTRALYEWINNNIEYERGTGGLPKHSYLTFKTEKGDCDEQSFLFCSMSRAVGIPAWVELGVLFDRVANRWGGHGWVRLQFVNTDNEVGWVNIDLVNDQFFARDATRFTSWVDDGESEMVEIFDWNNTPGSGTDGLIEFLNNKTFRYSNFNWDGASISTPPGSIRVQKGGEEAVFTIDERYREYVNITLSTTDDRYPMGQLYGSYDGDSFIVQEKESHIEDYYLFMNYSFIGDAPSVSINDQYDKVKMDTEGQVVLGDESVPGFEVVLMIPVVIITAYIYRRKKRS